MVTGSNKSKVLYGSILSKIQHSKREIDRLENTLLSLVDMSLANESDSPFAPEGVLFSGMTFPLPYSPDFAHGHE